MTESGPPVATQELSNLAILVEEVSQLRDLFHRRLFEDKAKNRLYEELYEQVALARGALAEQLLTPVLRDLLLVVDRIFKVAADGDVVLQSVGDELLEILSRRDVRPVPVKAVFDPQVHEAVGSASDSGRPTDSILQVTRRGYLLGNRLLRAEQVIVAVGQSPAATGSSIDEVAPVDSFGSSSTERADD